MPLHLEPRSMSSELDGCRSVMIVSCPICPPVSLATDNDAPFKEVFRSGIKTPVYEEYIRKIRDELEQGGVETRVFTSYLPCATMCIWTKGQRNRLRRRAKACDAALVMGCESVKLIAEQALEGTGCKVVLGMDLVGITNARLSFRFPGTVNLDNARIAALPKSTPKDAPSHPAQTPPSR